MFVCPVRKISQVIMKWRRRASHLGRFILWHNGRRAPKVGRFTFRHNFRRATQLGRFTLKYNERWATQLGKFTLWNKGRRARQPGLMHTAGVAHIFQKQWRTMLKMWVEGLIQSKINGKLLKDERFGRFSKQCNVYAFWRFSKLLKDERLTKTE